MSEEIENLKVQIVSVDSRLTGLESRFSGLELSNKQIEASNKRIESTMERLVGGQVEQRDNDERRLESAITKSLSPLKEALVERISNNARDVAEIRPQVEEIKRAQLTNGKPNYPVIISGASFLLAMTLAIVTAGGYFTNSKVDSRVSPLESNVNALRIGQDAIVSRLATLASREELAPLRAEVDHFRTRDQVIASENATSKAERAESLARTNALSAELAAIQADRKEFQAFVKTSLTEVETQVDTAAQSENLRYRTLFQKIALLWQMSYGVPLPDDFVNINISNRKPPNTGSTVR